MRYLALLALSVAIVGCGSAPRKPASAEVCKVVKHDTRDWYRLTVHDKPAFDSWYTKDQADMHYNMYVKKGKCQ